MKSIIEPLATMICGLEWAPHYNEWERLVFNERRLMVICSRDHSKSTFFSILYPLFQGGRNSNYSTTIFSYSEDQAAKAISGGESPGIENYIETKPLLAGLRPKSDATRSDGTWSKTKMVLSNGSNISSNGFGSATRGIHSDLIVIDDPVKDFSSMPDDDQERYYNNVIVPMCKPDGQIIIAGNYVRDNDLISRLEARGIFKVVKYPAINAAGEALWPSRWPLEKLDFRRREVGDYSFSREYMLEKIDPATQFFKKEWIRFYDKLPERLNKVLRLDPAITAKGDFTAMVAVGTDEENKSYVLDYANIKTDNVKVIVDTLFTMAMSWGIDYLILESIGFQRMLKTWIHDEMRKRNYFFGIKEIKAHSKSKEARIMAIQPRIQSGSLMFKPGQQEIIEQLMVFPRGRYDDLIDALSMEGPWDGPEGLTSGIPDGSWAAIKKSIFKGPTTYQEALFSDLTGNA